jgi:hypothetical protein
MKTVVAAGVVLLAACHMSATAQAQTSEWKSAITRDRNGHEVGKVAFIGGKSRNEQLTANLGVHCSSFDQTLTVRLTAGKQTPVEFGTANDEIWPVPTVSLGYYSVNNGPQRQIAWHLSQNTKRVRVKPPESIALVKAMLAAEWLRVAAENRDLLPVDYVFVMAGARAALAPILEECGVE